MTYPSKRHRQLIVNEIVRTAFSSGDDALTMQNKHKRLVSLNSLAYGADRDVSMWMIHEIYSLDSSIRGYRDHFLDSKIAIQLVKQLSKTGARLSDEYISMIGSIRADNSLQYVGTDYVSPGYWEDDDLDMRSGGTVLVSGTGDGGLIDTIRAAMLNFDHELLIEKYGAMPEVEQVGRAIAELDQKLINLEKKANSFDLLDAYMRIPVSDSMLEFMRSLATPDVKVVLNHRDPQPFTPYSAQINKVFVLLLIRIGAVKTLQGNLITIKYGSANGTWDVVFRDSKGDDFIEVFDFVVVRHGANGNYFQDVVGREIAEASTSLQGAIAHLGLTERLDSKTDEFYTN